MKWNFKRRECEFGVFKNGRESEGKDRPLAVKVVDLPILHQITMAEIDMVVPAQGIKTSQYLYGIKPPRAKGWQPQRQTHVFPFLKVYRHPEHIILTIYDDSDKRRALIFEEVSIEGPVIELEENVAWIRYKAKIHPGEHFARIAEKIEAQKLDFECRSTRPELFDEPDEEEEEEEGEDDGQTDIEGETAD